MSSKNTNVPVNNFYTKLFNMLSQDLKACITCDKYNTCEKTSDYLGYCNNYNYYLYNKKSIQKPKLVRLVYAERLSNTRIIEIECTGKSTIEFITKKVAKYGHLQQKKSSVDYCDIRYYTVTVSNLYHVDDVLRYILAYNK